MPRAMATFIGRITLSLRYAIYGKDLTEITRRGDLRDARNLSDSRERDHFQNRDRNRKGSKGGSYGYGKTDTEFEMELDQLDYSIGGMNAGRGVRDNRSAVDNSPWRFLRPRSKRCADVCNFGMNKPLGSLESIYLCIQISGLVDFFLFKLPDHSFHSFATCEPEFSLVRWRYQNAFEEEPWVKHEMRNMTNVGSVMVCKADR